MKSPNRSETMAIDAGQRQEEEIAALTAYLAGNRRSEQEEAAHSLLRRGVPGIEALLAALARENRRYQARFWGGFVVGMVILGTLLGLLDDTFHLHLTGLVGGSCLGIMAISAQLAETSRRRCIFDAFSQCDDVRIIGYLVEALTPSRIHLSNARKLRNSKTEKTVLSVLVRLLPRLRAEDVMVLSSKQKSLLHQFTYIGGSDLKIAYLKALGQIGDSSDIPYVKKLAEGRGIAKKHPEVRAEAARCLESLQQRAEQEKQRQTLLRPAAAPDDPARTLLRPAEGVSETDQALLLRPSTCQSSPE